MARGIRADGPAVKIKSPCLLRERRLTTKPRIIKTAGSGFIVERMVPSSHPSIRGKAECKAVDTFQEAIAKAHEWAGPKPKETLWPH